MGEKRKKNSNLLYFKNRESVWKYRYIVSCLAWFFCIIFSLIYTFTQENSGFVETIETIGEDGDIDQIVLIRLNVVFLPIIGLEFIVPIIYRICEAWSNAVMRELFNQLLEKNEMFKGGELLLA